MKVKPKPSWLKVNIKSGVGFPTVRGTLRNHDLHTVCEEARCPNLHECWSHGTATIMILGDVCTRGCRFCAVKTGNPGGKVDPMEPMRVAAAIKRLDLRYVVLTMVDRDDLPDGGAYHVAETVKRIKEIKASVKVETLVGDFRGDKRALNEMLFSPLDVFAHNIETIRRLTPYVRDRRASYDLSLNVLGYAKKVRPDLLTKSGIMVGMGETFQEVVESMKDLRDVGVDILTIGQYLQPTPRHYPVHEYVPPELFKEYREVGLKLGFREVFSGPLVRSSYRAEKVFEKAL
ncbi:MAG: lipoyl synthase [Thermotogae bacterium]|nr:lipoyl synthase [Thermotogota bacterium]